MQPGRRWKKITFVGRPGRRRSIYIEHAVRHHVDEKIVEKICIGFFGACHEIGQMPRQPQVVMAKKRNIASARTLQAFVVRSPLDTDVDCEIDPMQTFVPEVRDLLFAPISTAVANNPRFEIRELLCDETLQCATKRGAAVICRHDHRDSRHFLNYRESAYHFKTSSRSFGSFDTYLWSFVGISDLWLRFASRRSAFARGLWRDR